jgi:primase-polymerase (primpol)-like protein
MLQEGLLGTDLDKCRDKVTGEVSAWGLDLVRRGDTNTEISPSGTGLKMIMMADLELVRSLPEFAGRKKLRKQTAYEAGRVEVYDRSSNRFFTVTGNRFGNVSTIEDRQD